MSDIHPLIPRQPVPPLEVAVVGGGKWRLADHRPQNFTMLVFYRGLHCPFCSRYLGDVEGRLAKFEKRGVSAIAVSSDDASRAAEARETWKLASLRVGYGIDLADARRWGLYVSTGRGKTSIGIEEPALFSEPGLFLVRPDGTLYFASVQTMPFARPNLPTS